MSNSQVHRRRLSHPSRCDYQSFSEVRERICSRATAMATPTSSPRLLSLQQLQGQETHRRLVQLEQAEHIKTQDKIQSITDSQRHEYLKIPRPCPHLKSSSNRHESLARPAPSVDAHDGSSFPDLTKLFSLK